MNQELPKDKIDSLINLYSEGKVEDALNSVEYLIDLYPNEVLLHNICGACYENLGLLDKAVSRYEKALSIKPDYAEAHNNLGISLQKLDKVEEAVLSYKKALALKPQNFLGRGADPPAPPMRGLDCAGGSELAQNLGCTFAQFRKSVGELVILLLLRP